MKRLWFSLCLLRLEQRNEVCEFQESSEIAGIVLQDVFALSYSPLCFNIQTRLQVYYQKPTQTAGEESLSVHHMVFAG